MKLLHALVLGFHVFVPTLASAGNGSEGGNGGSAARRSLIECAQEGVAILSRSPSLQEHEGAKIILAQLEEAIRVVPVFSKRKVYDKKGSEVAVVNYSNGIDRLDPNYPFEFDTPSNRDIAKLIVVGEEMWERTNPAERTSLAVHEYLDLIGVHDLNFEVSSVLFKDGSALDWLDRALGSLRNPALDHLNEGQSQCESACDAAYPRMRVFNELTVVDGKTGKRAGADYRAWDTYLDFLVEVALSNQCFYLCSGDRGRADPTRIRPYFERAKASYSEPEFNARFRSVAPKLLMINDGQSIFRGKDVSSMDELCEVMPNIALTQNIVHGSRYAPGSPEWNNISNYIFRSYCSLSDPGMILWGVDVQAGVVAPRAGSYTPDLFQFLVDLEKGRREGDIYRIDKDNEKYINVLEKAQVFMPNNFEVFFLSRWRRETNGKPDRRAYVQVAHIVMDSQAPHGLVSEDIYTLTRGPGLFYLTADLDEEIEAYRRNRLDRREVEKELTQERKALGKLYHRLADSMNGR